MANQPIRPPSHRRVLSGLVTRLIQACPGDALVPPDAIDAILRKIPAPLHGMVRDIRGNLDDRLILHTALSRAICAMPQDQIEWIINGGADGNI